MRLININTLKLGEFPDSVPHYAILSHRWREDELSHIHYDEGIRDNNCKGASKIRRFCRFVNKYESLEFNDTDENDDTVVNIGIVERPIEWVWIDTCCIDKSSSSELSEAINSMFQWYREARYCVAFLDDVPTGESTTKELRHAFIQSEWFTRGWTLQELVAPNEVVFCDAAWRIIGNKQDQETCEWIERASGIESRYLRNPPAIFGTSIARRMSWASARKTSRIEDLAYSLLGLFDVNMPLIYGERLDAFTRLQLEIIKQSDDESIFAWAGEIPSRNKRTNTFEPLVPILAPHPRLFESSKNIYRIDVVKRKPYAVTNKGLQFEADAAVLGQGDDKVYVVQINCAYGSLVRLKNVADETQPVTPCVLVLHQADNGVFCRARHDLHPNTQHSGGWLLNDYSRADISNRRISKAKTFLLATSVKAARTVKTEIYQLREGMEGYGLVTSPQAAQWSKDLFGKDR